MVVRYEQMPENPGDVLRAVLQFFGVLSMPNVVLEEAVAYASYSKYATNGENGNIPCK